VFVGLKNDQNNFNLFSDHTLPRFAEASPSSHRPHRYHFFFLSLTVHPPILFSLATPCDISLAQIKTWISHRVQCPIVVCVFTLPVQPLQVIESLNKSAYPSQNFGIPTHT